MFQLLAHSQASLHSSPGARASPRPWLTQGAGDAPGRSDASRGRCSPRCREVNACGGQGRGWAPRAAVPTTWKSVGSATRLALLGTSWAGNPQPGRVSGKTRRASASQGHAPSLENLKHVAEAEPSGALASCPRVLLAPSLSAHVASSRRRRRWPPRPPPTPRQVLSPGPPHISPVLSSGTDHRRPT